MSIAGSDVGESDSTSTHKRKCPRCGCIAEECDSGWSEGYARGKATAAEKCETNDCAGIPNICGDCERSKVYAAERKACAYERNRIADALCAEANANARAVMFRPLPLIWVQEFAERLRRGEV